MSDMTEGDKYKVWGWSNSMTGQQSLDLHSMNLTESDVETITNLVDKLASKATADNLSLRFQYYHPRKNMETGEIDIILLDVDKNVHEMSKNLDGYMGFKDENKLDAYTFVTRLKTELSSNLF